MANHTGIPTEFLIGLSNAGRDFMQQIIGAFAAAPGGGAAGPAWPSANAWSPRATRLAELQQEYFRQVGALWGNALVSQIGANPQPVASPDRGDRRFDGAAWREQPHADLLRQAYIVNTRFLSQLVEEIEVDERARGRLRFFVRLYLDALSPANFLATNPEAARRAVESRGESIAAGLRNLLEDLRKGRISMTDEAAFEVGRNLAVTPGAVVFENELMQLIQYAPLTGEVCERPLLIVPPCINKFYILDLEPGNSFVRHALEQGHTVFMISWRNAKRGQGHLTWDDYLELGVLQAIEVACEVCGVDQVQTLGFCVGGTLLASAVAVLRARGEEQVASMTLLTTMLDFADTGEIGLLIDEASVAARELSIGKGGLLSGRELSFVFASLRANDLVWSYVVNNYLKGATPDAFDLLYWNADSTNLPGPMYCWYVRNAYLENNLKVAGRTTQCGMPVDLSAIDMPVYLLATREDHIVPWHSAYATRALVGGPVRFVLGASGHIAGVINPPGRKKRHYWCDGEAEADHGRWLETARQVPGSWWPDWDRWLALHGGDRVDARTELGSARHPVTEPAPGRYVKEKA